MLEPDWQAIYCQFMVGKSMSGAFLAHGYQANRIIALKDSGVMVQCNG